MWIAGAALVLSGCSYIPDWANPVEWYDNLFTDDGAAFLDAPREAGEGGFPVVADVPGAPPPVAASAERQALAEGLAGDLENARYLEQQLRQGGAAEAAAVVAAAPQSAIAPAPVITPAPHPPAVPVAVVEAAPLPAPPAPVPAPGPVMPAAPVAPGLAEIGVPELAVPLPPGAAAAGLAVIAEAAPLPDLGAGLTPLLPALPPAGAVALAEPVPAPALNPALPAAAPAPAVAIAAPALVPALPAVPALPQMAAVAPPPTPGIAGCAASGCHTPTGGPGSAAGSRGRPEHVGRDVRPDAPAVPGDGFHRSGGGGISRRPWSGFRAAGVQRRGASGGA